MGEGSTLARTQLASRQMGAGRSLQRSVGQSNGIALAFHRQTQYSASQLIGLHGSIADRLERQPRFVERRLQKHQRLRIKGVVVEEPRIAPPST